MKFLHFFWWTFCFSSFSCDHIMYIIHVCKNISALYMLKHFFLFCNPLKSNLFWHSCHIPLRLSHYLLRLLFLLNSELAWIVCIIFLFPWFNNGHCTFPMCCAQKCGFKQLFHPDFSLFVSVFLYVGWSFNSGTDFFWGGSYNTQQSGNKAGQVATLCKCTRITGSQYLPAFALWKPLSERLSAVCVASHDGGESSAAYVHQFLFLSGENWCWNVWNAASSFWRVLPKSIADIWVAFPFQKWTPILWI